MSKFSSMSYSSKMSNSSKKKISTVRTDESLEMEEVLELKTKKRPFNPYRMRGVVVPPSWLMLDRCQCFHRVFSKEEVEMFQNKLEEDFCNMMKESYRVTTKCGLHNNLLQNSLGTNQDETFSLVERAIRKATEHALNNEPPPTMSPGTRAISLNILELLASLYSIDIPTRRSTNNHSQLLIYLSDWTAKILANIYSDMSSNDDSNYAVTSPSSKLSIGDEDEVGSLNSFDATSSGMPVTTKFSQEQITEIMKVNAKSSSSQEELDKFKGESSNSKQSKNLVLEEIMTNNSQIFSDSLTDLDLITKFIKRNKKNCRPLTVGKCLHESPESSSLLTRCKKITERKGKGCLKKDVNLR
nr:uncharacterized protein LOC111424085 [Onthophagus taurus]